ncbi:MAG: hypothetical protein ACRDTT_15055 [Pseudonocardiaceae bacterium]
MTTYHVRVERGDRYWLVHVVELDRWTQARTLREVEPMTRDLVATMAGAAPNSFDLTTDIALPDEVTTHLSTLSNCASSLGRLRPALQLRYDKPLGCWWSRA